MIEDSVSVTAKTWARMPKPQKEEILVNLGFDKSFAEAKTMPELVGRGE